MGLDTKTNVSLWRDKALIEINFAVLHSFRKAGVTILDHHTASEQFMKHHDNETQLRGGCPSDWVWIVPPLSGHLTPVYHLEMLNYQLKPSYQYQEMAWKNFDWDSKTANVNSLSNIKKKEKIKTLNKKFTFRDIARAVKFSAKLMRKALAKRIKCTIIYATETGKSESFAKTLVEIFKHAFDAKLFNMSDYDIVNLEHESLLLIVTSTFGNGDPPENGEEFKKFITQIKKDTNQVTQSDSNDLLHNGFLNNVRYSVFGLGNSSYPKFCSFAKFLSSSLKKLGGDEICDLGMGDELSGQEDSFKTWSIDVFKKAIDAFCIEPDSNFIESLCKDDSSTWNPLTLRLTLIENQSSPTTTTTNDSTSEDSIDVYCRNLKFFHSREITACSLIKKYNLINEKSE
jgi:nitric-oxide synthase, brain